MDSFVVQAWINDVATANNMPDTPSPKKRSRTSHNDEIELPDPDKTPVRQLGSSTQSASAFQAALVSRPGLSTGPSSGTSPSQNSSPSKRGSASKRFRKLDSLATLALPVYFTVAASLRAALPIDTKPLFEALLEVRKSDKLLPAAVRSHADFQDNEDILDSMWSGDGEGQGSIEANKTARENHEELRRILAETHEAINESRFELGWNNLVHTPMLKLATRDMPFLMIEPVMSAQIMPAFRPVLASGQRMVLPSSSSATSATGSSHASGHGSEAGAPAPGPVAAIGLSVHKMVDYVVALRPSDELQVLIDAFLLGEPQGRDSINQTRYTPLRKRPAPIFIETKTTAGVRDGASVQLGVWLAAWYQRLRSLTALAGDPEKELLTLPLIQVSSSIWTVMFAVDQGKEIRVWHRNWKIGDTESILGIYQLQASLVVLGKWMKDIFEPWLMGILKKVMERRHGG